MNLLIVSTDFPPLLGGIATYTSSLAESLSKECRVTVAAPAYRGHQEGDAHLADLGITAIRCPLPTPLLEARLLFSSWKRLRRMDRPRAIFASAWFPAGLIAYLLHRLSGVPYYLAAHGSEFLDDRANWRRRVKYHLRFLKRPVFGGASGIFAVSRFTAELLREQAEIRDRLHVVPNGADPRLFRPHPNPRALKAKRGLGSCKVLLTVCRLDAHKGVHLLLRALPQVCTRHPDLIYAVVGSGPEESSLKELTVQMGLEERVKWLGEQHLSEVVEWYQLCDAYVTLSHEIPGRTEHIEGFGISFVEAAACAKPTLGCRFGGVPDAVLDGETGLLLPNPPSSDEIVEALDRLLTDKDLAHRLGEAGRRRVEDELNWDRAAQRILEVMRRR